MEAGMTFTEMEQGTWNLHGIPLKPEFGRFEIYYDNEDTSWPITPCFNEQDIDMQNLTKTQ